MAKQIGPVILTGTFGDITCYPSTYGNIVQTLGGVDGERWATHPNFGAQRKNSTEFGEASHAGKILRMAFRYLSMDAVDDKMHSRMLKLLIRVKNTDTINRFGFRKVVDGALSLLEGFEFNRDASLSTIISAPYTSFIDRSNGRLGVSIPSFIPKTMINAPAGATHFEIIAAAAAVDFDNERFVIQHQSAGMIAWDEISTPAIELINELTPISQLPLFLVLKVGFFQEVNGVIYSLKDVKRNGMVVVKVSKGL